jgi:hypothetical protein
VSAHIGSVMINTYSFNVNVALSLRSAPAQKMPGTSLVMMRALVAVGAQSRDAISTLRLARRLFDMAFREAGLFNANNLMLPTWGAANVSVRIKDGVE